MTTKFLDLLFPKCCSICKRPGQYLCERCKKNFKKNLPECYVCRRLSANYLTHEKCQSKYSLGKVIVAFEYNKQSSSILKSFKYSGCYDISQEISNLLYLHIGTMLPKDTLLVPVPISSRRRNERGFNQMELIVENISRASGLDYSMTFLGRKSDTGHQALRDRQERLENLNDGFFVKDISLLNNYPSVTIVDDVITTGSTLESISKVIKKNTNLKYPVNAICLFRGKPYF